MSIKSNTKVCISVYITAFMFIYVKSTAYWSYKTIFSLFQ